MLNKKFTFIFFSLFFLFIYNNIFYFKENNLENKYYELNVIINKGRIRVLNIDNKNLNTILYINNDENIEDGRYIILYKAKKIKNNFILGKIIYYDEKISSKILKIIFFNINKNHNEEIAGFIKSTLFGNRNDLDKDFKKNLEILNLTHVLAISSLHIGIMLYFFKNIFIFFKIEEKISKIILFIILLIYSLLIGFNVSIIRIIIFELILIINMFFKYDIKLETSYLIAFTFLILLDFNNIYFPSFIFSFTSLYILIFIYSNIEEIFVNLNWLIKYIFLNLLMQIYMMPFIYIFTKRIMIYSFIANIFILPLFIILIHLSFIIFFINFFDINFFNILLELFYYITKYLVEIFSKLKYITIETDDINLFLIIFLFSLLILIEILIRKFIDKKF